MEKFRIGTKVMVVRNSERIISAERIGFVGTAIGYSGKDVIVRFDDGDIGYIIECDLETL